MAYQMPKAKSSGQSKNRRKYTANINSSITDKPRFLSVISKQTHLFWNIFENCFNHRKMSVKIKIKNNTQQKNWEIFVIMKKF